MRLKLSLAILALLLVASVAALGVLYNNLSQSRQHTAQTTSQLETLQSEFESLQSELESVQSELESVQAELDLYHEAGIVISEGIQPPYSKPSTYSIKLVNEPDATHVDFDTLIDFVLEDPTDSYCYEPDSYVCTNSAEELHNNAEAAGIRAAFVVIHFDDGSDSHALNAFINPAATTLDIGFGQTREVREGLVFIDSTPGDCNKPQPDNLDCLVSLEIDKPYRATPLAYEGWYWLPSKGKVTQIEIYW